MLRHIVLTRSVYPPALWPIDANRRRLRLFAHVTARTLAFERKAYSGWMWAVIVDPSDPLVQERIRIARTADPKALILHYRGRVVSRSDVIEEIRKMDWPNVLSARSDVLLTTRVDDDDGFAKGALGRIRAAAKDLSTRAALMLPKGVRVWRGRYSRVRHETNAWCSILSPRGDDATALSFDHNKVRDVAPVKEIDQDVGWLWLRHPDTLSGHKQADAAVDESVRKLFDVDWRLLARFAS